jgi:hypothetical protein
MLHELISRNEARSQGLMYFYTGKECCNKHLSLRLVSNGVCRECNKLYSKKRRRLDKDRCRQEQMRSRAKHIEHYREYQRAYQRQWYANNRDKVRIYKANRKARKKALKYPDDGAFGGAEHIAEGDA